MAVRCAGGGRQGGVGVLPKKRCGVGGPDGKCLGNYDMWVRIPTLAFFFLFSVSDRKRQKKLFSSRNK